MATIDYYKILQIDPEAEQEVIEGAYRRLARKYHPDVNKSPNAHEHMKKINEAYDVLSDPSKRAAYDRQRKASTPPPPKPPDIVVSTTRLDFGTVEKGTKKSLNFSITNRGGQPTSVQIYWEQKPFWAEELSYGNTFPITVTVVLRTTAVGSHSGRIIIEVDGKSYMVSVSVFIMEPTPAYTPPVAPPAPPVQPPDVGKTKPKISGRVVVALVGVTVCLGFIAQQLVYSAHTQNNLVSGGLRRTVVQENADGKFFVDVWVKNDAWSTKYVVFELEGRRSNGELCMMHSYAFNGMRPGQGPVGNWGALGVKPGSTAQGRIQAADCDYMSDGMTITSCSVIVGSGSDVGEWWSHDDTTIPCSTSTP